MRSRIAAESNEGSKLEGSKAAGSKAAEPWPGAVPCSEGAVVRAGGISEEALASPKSVTGAMSLEYPSAGALSAGHFLDKWQQAGP